MRVTTRVGRDEGGAVVVLVALGIVFFIMGMLALTVDLGRAIGVKRDIVNAADGAALAAAQQCALKNGSGAAVAAAQATGVANGAETNELVSFNAADCPAGDPPSAGRKYVTVRSATVVEYFVAPYIGFDDATVAATATAMWVVPGVVPITVNSVALEGCDTEDPEGGEECRISYPKDVLENPRWGILDFATWGSTPVSSCPTSNSEIVDIIVGGGWVRRDPPAWACMDNGAQFNSWDTLVGGTWWFPVIDQELSTGVLGPAQGQGVPCFGTDPNCHITTAWVIDFVQLKVLGVNILPGTGGTIELLTETVPPPKSAAGIEIRLVD